MAVSHYGETLKFKMKGWYEGPDVQAERPGFFEGPWKFAMRCNRLGLENWYEYSPNGLWTSIGTWPTLKRGLFAASCLRSGSHYYDARDLILRPYTEEIYARLRNEPCFGETDS